MMQLWIYSPDYNGNNEEEGDDDNDNDVEGGIKNVTTKQESATSTTSSNEYKWIPVPTCRLNVTIPISGTLPIDVTANNSSATSSTGDNSCTLLLPNSARRRQRKQLQGGKQSSVKPLQALFRVEWSPPTSIDDSSSQPLKVIGDVPFELTHIKEKRKGYFWSNGDISSSSSSRRNLLDEPLAGLSSNQNNNNNNRDDGPQYVPYLKYGSSQAIMIRFVGEYRPYGTSGSRRSNKKRKRDGQHHQEEQLMRQDGVTLRAWNSTRYRPMIYVDDKSIPHSSYIELAPPEAKKPPISLRIKISSLSPLIDSFNRQIIQSLDILETSFGLGSGSELDEIRYWLQDERLYRFLLTQIISYIHMGLDYLAFRDEIKFYKGRRNLSGVSTSTVITRFLCSFIILLYLLDGGGTSWVVLLSLVSSCSIEAWKVWRLLRPRISFQRKPNKKFPYFGLLSVRTPQTTGEQDTQKYDHVAIINLAMVLYPLVIGWSLYALKHYTYKSWYSWFISNAANAVYTFGFIGLCPQLYINYKLKSVAHLPWKVFLYKIFNTFVDDAFAFLIEMPMKHRLMTFRDDVVFFILLFQVYMYRVDKTRTNEFGYSYGEEEEGVQKKEEVNEKCDASGAPDAATTTTMNGGVRISQQEEPCAMDEIQNDRNGTMTLKTDKLD